MKLKLIALAAVLAAAGSANAAVIDNGAGGNGGLMFSIWDGANSYSRNLGYSIDSFQAQVASATPLNLSWAADASFTSFLGAADLASLSWNVVATDTSGARRVLETFTNLPVANGVATNNNTMRNLAAGTQTFINGVNTGLAAANSAVFPSTAAGYAGGSAFTATDTLFPVSNLGTLSNNSAATGLDFLRVDALATGTAQATFTPYAQSGNAVVAYLDGTNTFHLAAVPAVPEPETYAMLLAGLGLMGAIARRRNKNSA